MALHLSDNRVYKPSRQTHQLQQWLITLTRWSQLHRLIILRSSLEPSHGWNNTPSVPHCINVACHRPGHEPGQSQLHTCLYCHVQIDQTYLLLLNIFFTLEKIFNTTRGQSLGSFASAWPKLIIGCDVRGHGLLQTDRTDITTGLHIGSFASTGSGCKKIQLTQPNDVYLDVSVSIRGLRQKSLFISSSGSCHGSDVTWQEISTKGGTAIHELGWRQLHAEPHTTEEPEELNKLLPMKVSDKIKTSR